MRQALSWFMQFIKEQNIIGAAIGIIMGLKVSEVVKSLVEDIIMPAILKPALRAANIEKIADLSYGGIMYGKFVSTLLDFLIVAAVVYFIINSFAKKFAKEETK